MKLSKYAVVVRNHPDEAHSVLFSTLTRSVVQVSNAILKTIQERQSTEDSVVTEMLRRAGLILDDAVDEAKVWRLCSCQNRYKNSVLQATLTMTYACNLACKYCYENGVRQDANGEHISPVVLRKIVRWIESYCSMRGVKTLDLCFHGGEPLLNMPGIESASADLRKLCAERGIEHLFSIVTNGVLLSPENTDCLVDCGVECAMITLDGPRSTHNSRRPFIEGGGSFETIIGNLKYATERLKVYITMNVDAQNCDAGDQLADELEEMGLKDKIHGVCVAFVEPTRPSTDHCRLYDMNRSDLARCQVAINTMFAKRGFRVRDILQIGHCTMSLDNAFIFDPYGGIFKCITGVGNDEFRVGHVDDDLTVLAVNSSQFVEYDPCEGSQTCVDCPYLPMCKGGCRHERYVRTGSMQGKFCMRDYYHTYVPEAVKELVVSPLRDDRNARGERIWIDVPRL